MGPAGVQGRDSACKRGALDTDPAAPVVERCRFHLYGPDRCQERAWYRGPDSDDEVVTLWRACADHALPGDRLIKILEVS